MKCPQCNLTTSDKNDVCPRCNEDLRPRKRELGLPIFSTQPAKPKSTPPKSTAPAASTPPSGTKRPPTAVLLREELKSTLGGVRSLLSPFRGRKKDEPRHVSPSTTPASPAGAPSTGTVPPPSSTPSGTGFAKVPVVDPIACLTPTPDELNDSLSFKIQRPDATATLSVSGAEREAILASPAPVFAAPRAESSSGETLPGGDFNLISEDAFANLLGFDDLFKSADEGPAVALEQSNGADTLLGGYGRSIAEAAGAAAKAAAEIPGAMPPDLPESPPIVGDSSTEAASATSAASPTFPMVAPEVMEFEDDDELLEQQLDEMIGDLILDSEPVKVPQKSTVASSLKEDTVFRDGDIEISFEFQNGDDDDAEETAETLPAVDEAAIPDDNDPILKGLMESFARIDATTEHKEISTAELASDTVPNAADEAFASAFSAALTGAASRPELRDHARALLAKLSPVDQSIQEELAKLLADAIGVSPEHLAGDARPPAGAATTEAKTTASPQTVEAPSPARKEELGELACELEHELGLLAQEGTTFLGAPPSPTDLPSVPTPPEEDIPDELMALSSELTAELDGLAREGTTFHHGGAPEYAPAPAPPPAPDPIPAERPPIVPSKLDSSDTGMFLVEDLLRIAGAEAEPNTESESAEWAGNQDVSAHAAPTGEPPSPPSDSEYVAELAELNALSGELDAKSVEVAIAEDTLPAGDPNGAQRALLAEDDLEAVVTTPVELRADETLADEYAAELAELDAVTAELDLSSVEVPVEAFKADDVEALDLWPQAGHEQLGTEAESDSSLQELSSTAWEQSVAQPEVVKAPSPSAHHQEVPVSADLSSESAFETSDVMPELWTGKALDEPLEHTEDDAAIEGAELAEMAALLETGSVELDITASGGSSGAAEPVPSEAEPAPEAERSSPAEVYSQTASNEPDADPPAEPVVAEQRHAEAENDDSTPDPIWDGALGELPAAPFNGSPSAEETCSVQRIESEPSDPPRPEREPVSISDQECPSEASLAAEPVRADDSAPERLPLTAETGTFLLSDLAKAVEESGDADGARETNLYSHSSEAPLPTYPDAVHDDHNDDDSEPSSSALSPPVVTDLDELGLSAQYADLSSTPLLPHDPLEEASAGSASKRMPGETETGAFFSADLLRTLEEQQASDDRTPNGSEPPIAPHEPVEESPTPDTADDVMVAPAHANEPVTSPDEAQSDGDVADTETTSGEPPRESMPVIETSSFLLADLDRAATIEPEVEAPVDHQTPPGEIHAAGVGSPGEAGNQSEPVAEPVVCTDDSETTSIAADGRSPDEAASDASETGCFLTSDLSRLSSWESVSDRAEGGTRSIQELASDWDGDEEIPDRPTARETDTPVASEPTSLQPSGTNTEDGPEADSDLEEIRLRDIYYAFGPEALGLSVTQDEVAPSKNSTAGRRAAEAPADAEPIKVLVTPKAWDEAIAEVAAEQAAYHEEEISVEQLIVPSQQTQAVGLLFETALEELLNPDRRNKLTRAPNSYERKVHSEKLLQALNRFQEEEQVYQPTKRVARRTKPVEVSPAAPWRRVCAAAIDLSVYSVLTFILAWLTFLPEDMKTQLALGALPDTLQLLALAGRTMTRLFTVWVLLNTLCIAGWGTTVGLRLCGARIVNDKGEPPDLAQAFLRTCGQCATLLTLGVGFMTAFGKKRTALQDMLSDTTAANA